MFIKRHDMIISPEYVVIFFYYVLICKQEDEGLKKRLLGIRFGLLCMACCLIAGLAFILFFNQSVCQQFLDLIDKEPNYQFTLKELNEYEIEIEQELNHAESRTSLAKFYYALGKVDALQEEYEQSNVNLLNALTLSDQLDLKLESKIYQELAINYTKLSDVEQGYHFFEKASQIMHELNDDEAKITLYSVFATVLVANTEHLNLPIQLVNEISNLVDDDYNQVNVQLLLSLIYKKSGLYDLALNELIKALDRCMGHDYTTLQRDILGEMSVLYFIIGDYQKSNETLNTYFTLINQQEAIEFVGIQLKNSYLLDGYEAVMKEIKRLEEEASDLSEDVKKQYHMVKDFMLTYVYLQEQQYDKSLTYLNELEQLIKDEQTYELMNLWLTKFRLDIDYHTDANQIDYLEAYQRLFEEVSNLTEIREGKFILLEEIIDTLASLGDYETIYHYMSMRQIVLSHELEGISSLTEDHVTLETHVNLDRAWNPVLVVTFILYSCLLMVIGGLIYAFCRHVYRIHDLKRLIQESKGIDSLTKTLTKKELYQQLEFELGESKEFCFLVIDIDDFTSYNESFGYLAGDEILKEIATLLKTSFPSAYISRHLGQQFIVVIPYESDECLQEAITSVMREMETNASLTEKRVLTLCMGVSKGPLMNVMDIDEQIKLASRKLNISKLRGKGIYTM